MEPRTIFVRSQFLVLVTALILTALVIPSHQQQATIEDSLRLYPDCGRPRVSSSRIAGGVQTGLNEFPWMVHLSISYLDASNNWRAPFTCSGALITDKHILTASHCFYGNNDNFGGFKLNITLGSSDLNGPRVSVEWSTIIGYGGPWLPNDTRVDNDDLAIVTLRSPIKFSDSIQPICLPSYNDPDHVNDTVVITGWGKTESGSSTTKLQKLETTVISSAGTNGLCQQLAGYGPFNGRLTICSDGSQGRYCSEDDGGPMNYYDASKGRWFVIGMAVRGNRTVNSCDITNKRPNTFLRIREQLDYIYPHIGLYPDAETTETPYTTRRTTTSPISMNCEGKPNGNYPDPASSCSKIFFMCSNGYAYRFECAQAETFYHPDIKSCDWSYNVPGCIP